MFAQSLQGSAEIRLFILDKVFGALASNVVSGSTDGGLSSSLGG